VALVLILNRLSAPRPLYQVTDWLARTVLVYSLGIPAEKFNDDRLGRTLEAIAPHARAIWLDIVQVVMLHFDIDLSVLFYDLTAFVTHGEYQHSQLAEFGFAHNTPMNKRKIKAGLTATKDGNLPLDYAPWAGSTADTATVQTNLEHLNQLFQRHGLTATQTVLLVGDRANLNDELALAYDRQPHLKYLAGLEARKKGHRALLRYPDAYFYRRPALDKDYWGLPCQVYFEHQGQHVTHQGLVVLSGPMRSALRQSRAEHFRNLRQKLSRVQQKIGQPHYRSAKSVQKHAQTCCRNSPVGPWITVWATETDGQVQLHWAIDRQALLAEMRTDGRYLLVTNDFSLSPALMFTTYRHKDGVEKCFRVSKQDLKVSPLYLHKDERIQGMLLINMLALLTYRLLERQARRTGLNLTFQRLIARLEDLTVVETYCWDGSVACRLTPLDEEQRSLLLALADILKQLRWPHLRPTLSALSVHWLLPEPDPCHPSGVIPQLPLG
jgi:transposase